MDSVSNNISKLLDLEPLPQPTQEQSLELVDNIEVLPADVEGSGDVKVDEDVEFARTNIKNLIEKGNAALTEILSVAKESQHPRAFEVAANLLKNMADLNKDLMEIHKRKRDLLPKDYSKQNINVDKAVVFTGSTAELVKLIKKNMEE